MLDLEEIVKREAANFRLKSLNFDAHQKISGNANAKRTCLELAG